MTIKYENFDDENQISLSIESLENAENFRYISLKSFDNCMKCFEFSFSHGTFGGFHLIGFNAGAKLFTFYTYNLYSQFVNINMNDDYRPNITKTEYNKRYMLCINTFAQRLHFVTENQTYTNKIKVEKNERIRIVFANGKSSFNKDTFELFFGKEGFVNEIPFGFVPWISHRKHNLSRVCLTNKGRRMNISSYLPIMITFLQVNIKQVAMQSGLK